MGFRLDPRSEELISDGLPLLNRVSGDRIRHELEQIFAEPEPERTLFRLDELGILSQIQPSLHCDRWLQDKYQTLRQEMQIETWDLKPEDCSFLHLALLSYRLDEEALAELARRLKMKRDDADDLHLLLNLQTILPDVGKTRRPSTVYRLLEPYPARVLAAAWVTADRRRLRERLLRYQTEWRLMETEITGNVLKAMGLRPSPLFGRLLGELRDARLDGRVSSREGEITLLEKLLEREEIGREDGRGDRGTG